MVLPSSLTLLVPLIKPSTKGPGPQQLSAKVTAPVDVLKTKALRWRWKGQGWSPSESFWTRKQDETSA